MGRFQFAAQSVGRGPGHACNLRPSRLRWEIRHQSIAMDPHDVFCGPEVGRQVGEPELERQRAAAGPDSLNLGVDARGERLHRRLLARRIGRPLLHHVA